MWYDQFPFWEKNPGLTEPAAEDYFARPFSEQEFAEFPAINSLYRQGKMLEAFPVPPQLRLPAEHQELLAYSNGGVILNGEREFSYFGPEDIRGFYIRYGFPFEPRRCCPLAWMAAASFTPTTFNDRSPQPSWP